MSSAEFFRMFPDDEAAVVCFEQMRWPGERHCPFCGSANTAVVKSKRPQPYRCREKECRKSFSAKVGTVLHGSNLTIRDWLYAMYLMSISKKGLSSLQLARELHISQDAAWRLGRKISEAWNQGAMFPHVGRSRGRPDPHPLKGRSPPTGANTIPAVPPRLTSQRSKERTPATLTVAQWPRPGASSSVAHT